MRVNRHDGSNRLPLTLALSLGERDVCATVALHWKAQRLMPSDTLTTTDVFLEALDRLEVGWTRVPAQADLAAALAEVLVPPAVAATTLFDGGDGEDGEALCDDLGVVHSPTVEELRAARTGVTAAVLGVADYGSLLIENAPDGTEPVSLFPEKHVAVLRAEAIVPDMPAAFRWLGRALRERKASFVFATGPSATADMGALVRGAHGPKTVHVIIVEA